MIDLTDIITAVLGLIAALITYYLIPWLKERTTAQQQERLTGIYKTVVFAAEQIWGAGHGQEKLEYAVSRLKEKGIKVDIDMIEALVRQNFGNWEGNIEGKDVPSTEKPETENVIPKTGT